MLDISWQEGITRFLGNCVYTVRFEKDYFKLNMLSEDFAKLFIELRLTEKVRGILQDVFYYEKEAELAMISHQVYEAFHKRLLLYDELNKKYDPFQQIKRLFQQILYEEDIIQYDTLLQFNRKRIDELLLGFVSLCIDDYKNEQEYQAFLHSVREYLNERKQELNEIHILQSTEHEFYTKEGLRLSKSKLKSFMQDEVLATLGYLAKDFVLAPLVAINPERIYIYGADISSVKTIALLNVFEERVKLKHYDEFPFSDAVS